MILLREQSMFFILDLALKRKKASFPVYSPLSKQTPRYTKQLYSYIVVVWFMNHNFNNHRRNRTDIHDSITIRWYLIWFQMLLEGRRKLVNAFLGHVISKLKRLVDSSFLSKSTSSGGGEKIMGFPLFICLQKEIVESTRNKVSSKKTQEVAERTI